MSIDPKKLYDPATEAAQPPRNDRRRAAPLAAWLLAISMIIGWAFLCRSCIHSVDTPFISVAQHLPANGGSNHGRGSGSGDSGNGPGAGEQGSGAGRIDAPADSGTGSTNDAPGNAVPGSGQERRDGRLANTPQRRQLPQQSKVESLARPLPRSVPRTPVKTTGGSVAGRKGFYGVESSRNGKSIFIVDVSGSMVSPSSEYPGKTRLEVMKMELRKTLFQGQTLTEDSYNRSGGFVIIAFSDNVRIYPQQKLCRYRNRSAMKDAKKFIDQQLYPGGSTVMRPAWKKALAAAIDESADEIFFLTDGESQDNLTFEWLQKLFRNLPGKVKVHCIALGINQEFMKKAAAERRGQYIYIP